VRAQAVADILRSALCCYSNETRTPIPNPPNAAQLGGTPTIPPSYIRIRAVMCACGRGQTDTHTQTRVTNIHFASSTTHEKCNHKNSAIAKKKASWPLCSY